MGAGTCRFDGCGKTVVARGLCTGHYNQQRKGQQLRALQVTGSADGRPWAEKTCTVHGCPEPAHCRGYCQTHYSAVKRHGDPLVVLRRSRTDPVPDRKACSRCGQVKTMDEFPERPEAIDGRRGVCRGCRRESAPRKTSRRNGVTTACMFDGCPRPGGVFGRCTTHHQQWTRHGEMWPAGQPRPAHNRSDADQARVEMLAAGFSPSVPYQGANTPWPGYCLRCGHPGRPRLGHLRARQSDPCQVCAGKVVPDDIRWGTMVARGFTPLEPYPGGAHRKWRTRHACGAEVAISWHHVTGNVTPWCVHCMELGGYRPGRQGWFYAVTDRQVLKAGVTNKPRRRLAKHAEARLTEVLHLLGFTDGHIPLAMEEQWRQYVKASPGQYRLIRELLPDGYTEAVLWHPGAVEFLDRLCRTQAPDVKASTGRTAAGP